MGRDIPIVGDLEHDKGEVCCTLHIKLMFAFQMLHHEAELITIIFNISDNVDKVPYSFFAGGCLAA